MSESLNQVRKVDVNTGHQTSQMCHTATDAANRFEAYKSSTEIVDVVDFEVVLPWKH